jgi:hypothetical protein
MLISLPSEKKLVDSSPIAMDGESMPHHCYCRDTTAPKPIEKMFFPKPPAEIRWTVHYSFTL